MKNFNQKELDCLSKKEWKEPQMTQLDVKETKNGPDSSPQETFFVGGLGATHSG